jgi:hypothetical protein
MNPKVDLHLRTGDESEHSYGPAVAGPGHGGTTPPHNEILVATVRKSHDAGLRRSISPITIGAVLLGFYIAMYLAVAALVHALSSQGAAIAPAPDRSMAPAAAATASAFRLAWAIRP